ncbi:MAG: ATP-binding protein [Bacillota bacterium]
MLRKFVRPADIKYSLQTQMIISIVLMLSILMIVTTYAGIKRESQGIFEQMQKDGIALAKSYALSVENALLLKAGLGRITGEASRTVGIKYLKIMDQNQKVIGHTNVAHIYDRENDPLYRQALGTPINAIERGNSPITVVQKGENGDDTYRVIVPLVILDSVVGVLEIGLDMASISEAIQRTNNQSLIISIVAFLFSGVFVWFFAHSLTRPIRNLVDAVERVAAGDLGQEIKVTGRDEIGHLALSFNYMTKRLKEYTGNLKRTNAQLEADAAIIEKLRSYNENILNSINPGVLTVDLSGEITTLNNAGERILQIDKETVTGKRIEQVFSSGDPVGSFLKEALSSLEVYQGREITVNDESKEMLLVFNTALLYEKNSELVGIAFTFEDITEMRQLQVRINESEKLAAMGGLAVGIAHEVRNPLGAIKTCAQFLNDKFEPEDARSKFPPIIIRETERLDQLIERLLDFTRPAEKDLQYEDLNKLIDNVATLATLKVNDQKLAVKKEYDDNLPRLFADAKRLQQAFLNIMLNAIDAMPSGGQLGIKTLYDDENRRIKIEISDTGEGIPPEKVAKIFNPFFSTRVKGTGLGLAIVQQIILEHNGTITVQSKVGEGTTFTIYLPLCVEQELIAEPQRFT